jgi:hypothetical protein
MGLTHSLPITGGLNPRVPPFFAQKIACRVKSGNDGERDVGATRSNHS